MQYQIFLINWLSIIAFTAATTSYTASSSYQSDNNYISNVIPDSNTDYNYQFNNQYYNQYENQYQYQYQQPSTYYKTETTEASTFRPLISIFKTATNLFSKPKSSGFRFGTVYEI